MHCNIFVALIVFLFIHVNRMLSLCHFILKIIGKAIGAHHMLSMFFLLMKYVIILDCQVRSNFVIPGYIFAANAPNIRFVFLSNFVVKLLARR